jgi:hypothetical protein
MNLRLHEGAVHCLVGCMTDNGLSALLTCFYVLTSRRTAMDWPTTRNLFKQGIVTDAHSNHKEAHSFEY